MQSNKLPRNFIDISISNLKQPNRINTKLILPDSVAHSEKFNADYFIKLGKL